MVRIKKQYKQPDGTLIEVEGTEEEIERFEKKQQKQKASNEQAEKKRTILYGKDLEEIRRIIREEIAAQPPRTVIEYRYFPYYNPYWAPVQPLLPVPGITWTVGQQSVSSGQITCQSNTDASYELSTTAATGTSWYTAQNTNGPVSVFNSSETAYKVDVGELKPSAAQGIVSGMAKSWNGILGGGSSNYLMSPRM